MSCSRKNILLSYPASIGVSLAGAVLLHAPLVHAQQVTELPEIVITASRTPQDLDKVGSSVDVITSKELAKHSQTYVTDYLSRLPGISIAQDGAPGSKATIRLRGATSKYIKVLIDGIDVSDPSGTQTAAHLEHLMVGDVERIEVLKGSQSTLYGGDAVAGVISITTKRASKNGMSLSANGEYGSYNTKRGSFTLGYGGDKGDMSVTVQGIKTKGFSAADENTGNSEEDGYENLTFSGRGSYQFSDSLRVFFAGRQFRSDVEFDDFGPVDDVLGNHATTKQKAGRVGAELSLFDGRFTNTLSVQGMEIERYSFSSYPGTFEGDRVEVDYKGLAKFHDRFSLLFGAEHEKTGAKPSSNGAKQTTRLNSLFAEALVEPIDNLNLTAGFRQDRHDEFGEFNTWRLTGAWYLPQTDTKFHASYGTGFRAPSLYELFDPNYGNSSLSPEESISWDAGVDQRLFEGKLNLSATYFSLSTENLVGFSFPAGYLNIIGTTKRSGVELAAKADLADWISTSAAYTYTDAKEESGKRLVRAPRHMLTLGTEVRPIDKLLINATAKIVTDTVDGGIALDDYVLLNAKISYELNSQVSAYVRGENLLDQEYQTVKGYGTSDMAVYAGVRIKLSE